MLHFARLCLSILVLTSGLCISATAQQDARPRIIVETDAGGDPDDEQSMVRFLLYANDLDVVGIIATRPVARPGENRNSVRDGRGIVRQMIGAYGAGYSKLAQHDPRYPSPEELRERTVAGYDNVDDGVRMVIAAVDSDDPRPLWFANWGTDNGSGASSLKRALDLVLKERGQEGYAKFKSRVYLSSSDQFGEHTTTMDPPFPIWINTFAPERDRLRWYHRFSALTATAGGFDIERDVRTGHGPLGELYPLNTTHPQKEGDTMTFLYLLPPGLSNSSEPSWGSWGGRYGPNENFPDKPYHWANVEDEWNGQTNRDNVLARWAEDFQNDFRARLDWCVADYEDANHHPRIILADGASTSIRRMETASGATIALDASGSIDPDRNALTFQWFVYGEAGDLNDLPRIESPEGAKTRVFLPNVSRAGSAHIILRVVDNGTPPLACYRRLVVDVKP